MLRPSFAKPPKHFILEDSKSQDGNSWRFEAPSDVIIAWSPGELPGAFGALEKARAEGLFLAGFISYEAGYAFEPSLAPLTPEEGSSPLLWFVAYERASQMSAAARAAFFESKNGPSHLSELTSRLSRPSYLAKVREILDFIRAGDIYQANLTYFSDFEFSGHPRQLFAALRNTQPVKYGAYIEAQDWSLLSSSPELFFSLKGGSITSRPMKGTAERGLTAMADLQEIDRLKRDPKQRSENLMILDLIRNDLSRLCEPGSVQVPSAFDVETYKTVHQMTSTVSGLLTPGKTLSETFQALFPCGSITGAPKIRAMEIIRDLELAPRGPYTGAIGMISPSGDVQFNVAIRSLLLERREADAWKGSIGVGGGIVHDSVPEAEWEECQAKLRFLNDVQDDARSTPFEIFETMRWSPGSGIDLLQRHVNRLTASAKYFDFSVEEEEIGKSIDSALKDLKSLDHIVRLTLSKNGKTNVTAKPLASAESARWRFTLCDTPVHSEDVYLYHKTTRREVYDHTLVHHNEEMGSDEVLFMNEKGELTEGSRSNFFIEKDGVLYTSPIECGLLGGTLRQELIENGTQKVIEYPLRLEDLAGADQCYFGNSVRGLRPAVPLFDISDHLELGASHSAPQGMRAQGTR